LALIAERVHALPEAVMAVCHELFLPGETIEWLAFEYRGVSADEIRDVSL
jgi:hypothetical protein